MKDQIKKILWKSTISGVTRMQGAEAEAIAEEILDCPAKAVSILMRQRNMGRKSVTSIIEAVSEAEKEIDALQLPSGEVPALLMGIEP